MRVVSLFSGAGGLDLGFILAGHEVVWANDHRIAREFLLFLANYGYLERTGDQEERFVYNRFLNDEITKIIRMADVRSINSLVERLKHSSVAGEIERKRVQAANRRPNQARFRHAVLGKNPRCVITNVTMSEVLEAAHIVPFKYHGEDTAANGLAMRLDIHQLFASGHLRINVDGEVFLTDRARMDYGASIPPCIKIPAAVNLDFVRWRWENYNGL